MWEYRVKPTLQIMSLIREGKIFRADKWLESEIRLTSEWHKAYLIEREITKDTQETEDIQEEGSSDALFEVSEFEDGNPSKSKRKKK